MKLGIICESHQLHSQRYIRYFVERGHEVHVITPVPPDPVRIDGAVVHGLHRRLHPSGLLKYANYLQAARGISRLIRSIRPDLLNVMFLTDYGFWAALSRFHPLAITPWGSDVLRHPHHKRFWKLTSAFALNHCDLLICNSDCIRSSALETLGAKEEKVRMIVWNGVDTDFFSQRGTADVRLKLGLNGKRVIFSNRHLESNYRVDRIIAMFARLRMAMPETVLLIAGEGSQREKLQRMCGELHLDSSVVFIGRVSPEMIRDCLCMCDLYISVAESDSSATSVLEAMACGAQLMVSDSASNREWITHAENGWMIQPDDAKTFADLCRQALHTSLDPDIRLKNIDTVSRKASRQANMGALEEAFMTVIRHSGARMQ